MNLPEIQALITASSQSPFPCSARNPRQLSDWVRRNRTRLNSRANQFRQTRKRNPSKKLKTAPRKAPRSVSKTLPLPPPTPSSQNQPTSLLEAKGTTPVSVALPPKPVPEGGLSLFEVESYHCRWPVNPQNEDYRCCGAQKVFPYPYCQEHIRRAFNFNPRTSALVFPKRASTREAV